ISSVESSRNEIAKNVDEQLLKIYQKLLLHNPPVAVEAKDGMCGHCFMKIPPQTYIKVLELNEIILCPSCTKKILIPDLS
ncbi:MAG: C4-type zinc ribbon domain-containing protein, partial [Thermodesulfobacteriota bacterium]|nr:C4-type zinc ribbon domain-containing protein [Thermodesulfobacteriota bacterium]